VSAFGDRRVGSFRLLVILSEIIRDAAVTGLPNGWPASAGTAGTCDAQIAAAGFEPWRAERTS
jgi:hypothetical protein